MSDTRTLTPIETHWYYSKGSIATKAGMKKDLLEWMY